MKDFLNHSMTVYNRLQVYADCLAQCIYAVFYEGFPAYMQPSIRDSLSHSMTVYNWLQVYSDCLAQCIYAAFYEGFPESLRFFGDEFKQYLAEVITTWVSGRHGRF